MREEILNALGKYKIVAIVRGQRPEDMLRLAGALYEGGIRFMEVTFRQDAPESWTETAEAIRSAAQEFRGRIFAGAVGLGVGGNLVNSGWIREGRFDLITALAAEYAREAGVEAQRF